MPTQHYDNQRTGANLRESILNTSNVKAATFGKRAQRPLRGAVYAQPLYVSQLAILGAPRNVVYVATMRNDVYAIDANDPHHETYWLRQLAPAVALPDPLLEASYPDISDEIGVLGTPVLDEANGALYVVAASKDDTSSYSHLLYKLSLATGEDLAAPVRIEAEDFASERQAQRSALLLDHAVVYVSFGGYRAQSTAPGWIFAYDTELNPLGHLSTGPPGAGGGIWMAGQGPAADDEGRVYVATDGGLPKDSKPAPSPLASSLLAAEQSATALEPRGWLTPAPQSSLLVDAALGSSGPLLIPGADRALVAGSRYLYLVSRSALATQAAASPLQQVAFNAAKLPACQTYDPPCNLVYGSPVFWSGPSGARVYLWPSGDVLRSFRFDQASGLFDCGGEAEPACASASMSQVNQSRDNSGGPPQVPGGILSISANGDQKGSGIVWASHAYSASYLERVPDGVVRAYDADDLSVELWSTKDDAARDELGPMAKYVAPVVSGGQLFVPTVTGLSGKITLDENRSSWGPGLAAFGDDLLVLAWASDDLRLGFRLAWSHDGVDFRSSQTSFLEFCQFEPAIVSDGGSRLFMAWASDQNELKAAVFEQGDFSKFRRLTLPTVGGDEAITVSAGGPALAFGNGKLFLAWKNSLTNDIELLSSTDGESFDGPTALVSGLGVNGAPVGLVYSDSKLYVYWVDRESHITVMESRDDGVTFGNTTTLEATSLPLSRPGLVGLGTGGSLPDLLLFRSDPSTERGPMKMIAAENADTGAFRYRYDLFSDESPGSIAATIWRGKVYVAWTGSEGENHPNVARYSPGELLTYGPIHE